MRKNFKNQDIISKAIKDGVEKELKDIEARKKHPKYKIVINHWPESHGTQWIWYVSENPFPGDTLNYYRNGGGYTSGSATSQKAALKEATDALKVLIEPNTNLELFYMADGTPADV